jgi:hypothetical protein
MLFDGAVQRSFTNTGGKFAQRVANIATNAASACRLGPVRVDAGTAPRNGNSPAQRTPEALHLESSWPKQFTMLSALPLQHQVAVIPPHLVRPRRPARLWIVLGDADDSGGHPVARANDIRPGSGLDFSLEEARIISCRQIEIFVFTVQSGSTVATRHCDAAVTCFA